MVTQLTRVLAAVPLLTSLGATAQQAPTGTRPDPLDAKASVPPLTYRSSLPMARASEADRPITWREANETVNRIGGWRSYAREAQAAPPSPEVPALVPALPASAPAAAPKPADKPTPAAPGHGQHRSP